MSRLPLVSSADPLNAPSLDDLAQRMASFYNSPQMAAYFAMAHEVNEQWNAHPCHCYLRDLCRPGMRVLDLGCGSAHAWVNLRDRGVHYCGVDWSENQVAEDARRYGDQGAEFVARSLYDTGLPKGSFDVVFSLYVIEHLVYPQRFLREAYRLVKPGGHLFILCPHFRRLGRMPSFDFGSPVACLSAKIRQRKLLSALRHLWLATYHYPRMVRGRFRGVPFLINLAPTCLTGTYYPDNDAVYLADDREILAEIRRHGGKNVTPSRVGGRPVPRNVCLVVARKPLTVST